MTITILIVSNVSMQNIYTKILFNHYKYIFVLKMSVAFTSEKSLLKYKVIFLPGLN